MRESDSAAEAGVPDVVLDDLAQTLAEKLDILLDRLTDRALSVPAAGTAAWRSHWAGRDSAAGRDEHAYRLHLRAVLATRAGIHLAPPTAPPSAPAPRARSPRRRSVDADQLCIF